MLSARNSTESVNVKAISLRSFLSRLSSLRSSTKFLSDTMLNFSFLNYDTNISFRNARSVSLNDT